MIPIQLTVKGLYSYQDLTRIDFEPLVQARLFGIFGAVGSGKSAILEAIMFVLYDRTTRLNKAGDDRYYNMMNLQSNELVIDFIFKAGVNHQKKYRFYFKARRHPKDFGKVEVKDRSHYLWDKNDWVPISDPNVLGMTYENFMQTVIIPQGKFREFIDQKPAARTQMLKELFHLEKYELAPQAFGLLHEAKDQLTFLEGQLSQYSEINDEWLSDLQNQTELLQKQVNIDSTKTRDLSDKEAGMEVLRLKTEELQEAASLSKTLQNDKEFFEGKEHQLRRFEKVQRLFRTKIELQRNYLVELKSKQQNLGSLENNIKEQQAELESVQKNWEQVQQKIKSKELWLQETADLNLIIEYQASQREYDSISQQWTIMQDETSQLKQKEEALSENIALAEKNVKELGESQASYQQWLSASRWWEREQELEDRKQRYTQEWEQIDREVQDMVRSQRLLAVNEAALKNTTIEIEQLQQQLQSLRIQEDWEVHAKHLKEGKPCPLCGSSHHPKVLSSRKLESQIQPLQNKLKELLEEEKTLRKKLEDYRILNSNIKLKSQQGNQTKKKLLELATQMAKHQDTFPVPGLEIERPQDWQTVLEQKKQQAHQGHQSQERLNQLQESYRQLNDRLSEASAQLHETGKLREKQSGALDQKLELVRSLKYQDYIDRDAAELRQLLKAKTNQIQQAEARFEQVSTKLQVLSQELTRQKALWESQQQQVNELLDKSGELETDLQKLCKNEAFKNLAEIQKILSLELDAEQERKEISDFNKNLSLAKTKVAQLQKEIGQRVYDELQHRETKDELEITMVQLDSNRKKLAGIQHSLQEKQQQLIQKKELQEKQKQLTLRKQHIQEISNLLRGSGFINFISSTYLQNLCKVANSRFTKLTGNRLSLELNEHNDFMVRDYLNDGKLRLLKTLSGGQIFQASLCLALSLAENVKSFNQADQSFFFLDEGFGSLDRSSMQVVIEALKSLQQENRIVGIISHVEELQQEVDVYLSVMQQGEKGSFVVPSWDL